MKINKYVIQFVIIELPEENVFSCIDIQVEDDDLSVQIFKEMIDKIIPQAQSMMDAVGLSQTIDLNSLVIKTISLIDTVEMKGDNLKNEISKIRNNEQ